MSYYRPRSGVWRKQMVTVALIFCAFIIAYMDRSALSIATPAVRKEFGLSLSSMGLLLSVFPWAYGLSQLITGPVVDRGGPRLLAGLGISLWSLVQSATGLVGSMNQLFWARVGLGITESPLSPSSIRALRSWFRLEDRGLAISICFSGGALGPAIAPPVLTWLMLGWGWRAMFVIVGFVGVLLSLVWWAAYRDPQHYDFSEAERAELPDQETPRTERITIANSIQLFRFPAFWSLVLGNFGLVYLAWLFITWLPGYLEIERHMSVSRAGIYAGLPQLAGVFGFWAGGIVGDRLLRSGFSPMNSRKIPNIVGLLGMATATITAGFVKNDNLAISCFSIAVFFGSMSQPAQWALVSIVAPPARVSTFSGFNNFGGSLGGSLSAVVTGYIAQRAGSFVPALILGGVVATAAALLYGVGVRKPIPEESAQPRLSPVQ